MQRAYELGGHPLFERSAVWGIEAKCDDQILRETAVAGSGCTYSDRCIPVSSIQLRILPPLQKGRINYFSQPW